jgi:hypothetical protein
MIEAGATGRDILPLRDTFIAYPMLGNAFTDPIPLLKISYRPVLSIGI